MVTDRRFAHFKRNVAPPRLSEVPEGGFCFSAFVIISETDSPLHVLMGRLNRTAAWDHIGALDPERVARHSMGWMLPSSGLLIGESPREAAQSILKEQLAIPDQPLEGPLVFSEVYGTPTHWDLEFLFQGGRREAPKSDAWSELKFVDLTKTSKEEIARFHEDILTHVQKWKAT